MADESQASPAVTATERIRETAKWMTVSLAAIGGVLVAGSQLSDIGSLPIDSARFWVAVGGGIAAVTGVLAILLAAVWTATTPIVTIGQLARSNDLKAVQGWFSKNSELLRGRSSLKELSDEHAQAVKAKNAAYDKYLAAATDEERTRLGLDFRLAEAALLDVDRDATSVVQLAQFESVARRWRVARTCLVLGGISAAAGIALFAWASNPPADAVASSASPNVVTTPETKVLELTREGRTALASELGCDKPEVKVLLLASTAAGPDLLVQEADCQPIRLLLGPDWGIVA
jgi:hypothetical protein